MMIFALPVLLLHAATPPPCNYNPGVQWTALPLGMHVMPCSTTNSNPFQRWSGETLRVTTGAGVASALTNAGTPGYCLGGARTDPVAMTACNNRSLTLDGGLASSAAGATKFMYNHSTRTLGVAGDLSLCLNINHDTGPDVNLNRCPHPGVLLSTCV